MGGRYRLTGTNRFNSHGPHNSPCNTEKRIVYWAKYFIYIMNL